MSVETSLDLIIDEPFPMGSMKSYGGEISLRSATVTGDVQGVLFSSVISQEYENATDKNLEIIYTFPTGFRTVLLGMDAKIGEKELTGVVVEKNEAEEKYEQAVEKGDSAIMAQRSADGLYTANLGNIAAGEKVIVNLKCAQLLNFVKGRVRLSIPTVIDDYYGDQRSQGGLAPHERVTTDPGASYGFDVKLRVLGELARGEITSPTYPITVEREGGEALVRLAPGAVMNRDFVLVMSGSDQPSSALYIKDKDEYMIAASFAPSMSAEALAPLNLKILVDCSGSMNGGRIEQAKKGLNKILNLLQPEDRVSYTRFGSKVVQEIGSLELCDAATLKKLAKRVKKTDANLGGTEMASAISAVFKIKGGGEERGDVLLITDGDVWDVENIVEKAKKSGQRVFTVGVGMALGENLLRRLAEGTGGACELVTEAEDMAEAIARVTQRMRGAIAKDISVDWGTTPTWQSPNPKIIYDGETVTLFAQTKSEPTRKPILKWKINGEAREARCASLEKSVNDSLLRIGIYYKLQDATKKEKLRLALDYQLVTSLTSLILVYERPDGEKLKDLPTVQNTPQMRVKGRRMGGALLNRMTPCAFADIGMCFKSFVIDGFRRFISADVVDIEDRESYVNYNLLRKALDSLDDAILDNRSVEQIASDWLSSDAPVKFREEIERQIRESGLDREEFFAILIEWAREGLHAEKEWSRQTRRILKKILDGVSPALIASVRADLDSWRGTWE